MKTIGIFKFHKNNIQNKIITTLISAIAVASSIPVMIYNDNSNSTVKELPKYENVFENKINYLNSKIEVKPEKDIIYAMSILDETEEIIIPSNKIYNLSEKDYDLFLRVVAAEANYGSYGDSLAVATNILNRCESSKWNSYKDGTNPIAQIKRPSQYTVYKSGSYKRVKVSEETKEAVNDALNGKRSHNLLSFRSNTTSIYNHIKGYGVTREEYNKFYKEEIDEIIVNGVIVAKRFETKGNLFFNPMDEDIIII